METSDELPDSYLRTLEKENSELNQRLQQLQKSVANAPFNEPEYRDKYLLRVTEYRQYLHELLTPYYIDASTKQYRINAQLRLSKPCKETLLTIVNGYFDPNVIMSNNTDNKVSMWVGQSNRQLIRTLKFKITMILARTSYTALDVRNPDLANIEAMIEEVFEYVLTRTVGDKREGVLQHPHASGEVRQIQTPPTPEMMPEGQQQKRRGIFG